MVQVKIIQPEVDLKRLSRDRRATKRKDLDSELLFVRSNVQALLILANGSESFNSYSRYLFVTRARR